MGQIQNMPIHNWQMVNRQVMPQQMMMQQRQIPQQQIQMFPNGQMPMRNINYQQAPTTQQYVKK